MKRAMCVVGVLLATASLAQAQSPVCRTFVFPDQGHLATGNSARDTRISIPWGVDGIYPIRFAYPAGATRVGLEKWMHLVFNRDGRIRPGELSILGLIDRVDRVSPTATDNAVVSDAWFNVGTLPVEAHTFALSTVLNPGESYHVGMWNQKSTDHEPIELFFSITALVCFSTQAEMTTYIHEVER